MISKKISSSFLIPALIASLVFSFYLPNLAEAQAPTSFASLACPIDGDFSIRPNIVGDEISSDNQLSLSLELVNQTSYLIPGVSVGVGLYKDLDSRVPAFWSVLERKIDLESKINSFYEANLNLDTVPEGQYVLKAFMSQGEEAAVFGTALKDVEYASHIKLNKVTPQASDFDLTQTINGEDVSQNNAIPLAEGLLLTQAVKNNSTAVLKTELINILTQGDTPLASAAVKIKDHNVKVLPQRTQTHKFSTRELFEGDYTVYSVFSSQDSLQPVESIKIKVGEREGKRSWPYISLVAIADPAGAGEIVSCVNYVGESSKVRQLHDVLAVSTELTKAEKEIASDISDNLDGDLTMYFTNKPGTLIKDSSLEVKLLEDFGISTTSDRATLKPQDFMFTTQSIKINLSCEEGRDCPFKNKSQLSISEDYTESEQTDSFWFYIGVTLAALLLMYLMLGRLDTSPSAASGKLSEDELQ